MNTNVAEKTAETLGLQEIFDTGERPQSRGDFAVRRLPVPGRPVKPELIDGKNVPRRALGKTEGRIALLHALAHIEFNAINLALDAVYRFEMPDAFAGDWLQIAAEEAYHFNLIETRLQSLGSFYGAMPAHNSLWDMAVRTDHDVMVRMALVPRVQEARGLDVAPPMIKRLRQVGDSESADILEIIYRDEIGHVKIGNHWFLKLSEERGLDPSSTFTALLKEYTHGFLRGPFNRDARIQAGFSETELKALEMLDANAVLA